MLHSLHILNVIILYLQRVVATPSTPSSSQTNPELSVIAMTSKLPLLSSSRVVHLHDSGDFASSIHSLPINFSATNLTIRTGVFKSLPHVSLPFELDDEYYGQSDVTRGYGQLNSQDPSSGSMKKRTWPHHEVDPHCHPMQESWQSAQYPSCNDIHAQPWQPVLHDMDSLQWSLLSTKGYWRHAWKLNMSLGKEEEPEITVWKTFK
jgi:hypothetical protein